MPERLGRFCRNSLWLLSAGITGLLLILNILYTSKVAYSGFELVSFLYQPGYGLTLMLLWLLVTVSLVYVHRFLETADEGNLFRVVCFIAVVCGAYLIFNVDDTLRADPEQVYQGALGMDEGMAALQPGGYLYRYPHQLGFVLYERILFLFSRNVKFLYFVNLVFLLGINRNVWKISQELFADGFTGIVTIVLSFLFLPQLFFILFAYGLIPGFYFLTGGFLHGIRFSREGRWSQLWAMALNMGAAVLMKQNYLIGAIAMCLYLLLRMLKAPNVRLLAAVAAVLLCITLPGKWVQVYFSEKSGISLDNPSPSVLWIAMGTDIYNTDRGPGWYDSYSWRVYNEADFQSEAAAAAGRQKLRENWQKICAEPDRAGEFFLKKTLSQWCNPMFQSAWSGPLEDCGQFAHTQILRSVFTGGTWEEYISLWAKWLGLGIWSFALVFLLMQGRRWEGWELLVLYLVGGLLFHTVWEGKSQYTYTYLFVLIPLAANGFRRVSDLLRKRFLE